MQCPRPSAGIKLTERTAYGEGSVVGLQRSMHAVLFHLPALRPQARSTLCLAPIASWQQA